MAIGLYGVNLKRISENKRAQHRFFHQYEIAYFYRRNRPGEIIPNW
jgi:hypothetical protein